MKETRIYPDIDGGQRRVLVQIIGIVNDQIEDERKKGFMPKFILIPKGEEIWLSSIRKNGLVAPKSTIELFKSMKKACKFYATHGEDLDAPIEFCSHKNNQEGFEGNCNMRLCPIIEE